MKKIAVLFLAALLLTGCSGPSASEWRSKAESIVQENTKRDFEHYEVQKDDIFSLLAPGGFSYEVTNTKIEPKDVKTPIGIVTLDGKMEEPIVWDKRAGEIISTEDLAKVELTPEKLSAQERALYKFGFVYKLVKDDTADKIIVELNNAYYLANRVEQDAK